MKSKNVFVMRIWCRDGIFVDWFLDLLKWWSSLFPLAILSADFIAVWHQLEKPFAASTAAQYCSASRLNVLSIDASARYPLPIDLGWYPQWQPNCGLCVQDLVKVASFGPFLIVSWSDGLQFVPLGPIHLRQQEFRPMCLSLRWSIGWICHFPDSEEAVAFAIVWVFGFVENKKDYLHLCQLLLLIPDLSLSLFPSELIDIHLRWLADRLQFHRGML